MLREQLSIIQYGIFRGVSYFASWCTICTAAFIVFMAWRGWSSGGTMEEKLEALYWVFDGGPEAAIWIAICVIIGSILLAIAVILLLSILRGILWLAGCRDED